MMMTAISSLFFHSAQITSVLPYQFHMNEIRRTKLRQAQNMKIICGIGQCCSHIFMHSYGKIEWKKKWRRKTRYIRFAYEFCKIHYRYDKCDLHTLCRQIATAVTVAAALPVAHGHHGFCINVYGKYVFDMKMNQLFIIFDKFII